jgi:hypothetical protein
VDPILSDNGKGVTTGFTGGYSHLTPIGVGTNRFKGNLLQMSLKPKLMSLKPKFRLLKRKFRSWFHRFKGWAKEQISRFLAFFWPKTAQWAKQFATFSQQKATPFNVLELPSTSPELEQTIPVPMLNLLKALHGEIRQSRKLLHTEIRQSHELLENLVIQQNETNNKIIQLESQKIPKIIPIANEESTEQPLDVELADQINVESANTLRILLEKQSIFDENLWLKLWQENPAPCELAERLLNQYSPLENCDTEIYQALATWLETVSGNVQLIVPEINQAYESDQHEMIEHRSVKGRANRLLEIKLPGLRCDDTVQLKAHVVSS